MKLFWPQKHFMDDPTKQSIGVVIIGAGFAGLIGAANTLYKNGFKDFLVLEGRDRIGGRSHTSYALGEDLPVDLGSAWIQGKRRNPIWKLTKRHDIPYANVDVSDKVTASHVFFDGKNQVSDSQVEKLRKLHLDPFLTNVERRQKLWRRSGTSDMSLRQFVDQHLRENQQIGGNNDNRQLFEAALHSTIALEYAADLEDLSMLSWNDDDELNGGDCYMAVGRSNAGFSAVVEALAKPFRSYIQMSSVVKAINYGDGDNNEIQISYSFDDQTRFVVAKHVIITLPLGVLKADLVKFSPPLPIKKQDAITKMGNGICNKCILYWEDKDDFVVFWPKKRDWLVRLAPLDSTTTSGQDAWLEFYNAYKFNGNRPVLVGFSSGRDASAIEELTDEQVVRDAVSSLRAMFGEVPEPTKAIVTRWESDEFSRGSYSFLSVGCTQQYRAELGKSVDRKLFFAGEATETIFPSTTQGALITGERAAREIMKAINASEAKHTTSIIARIRKLLVPS